MSIGCQWILAIWNCTTQPADSDTISDNNLRPRHCTVGGRKDADTPITGMWEFFVSKYDNTFCACAHGGGEPILLMAIVRDDELCVVAVSILEQR